MRHNIFDSMPSNIVYDKKEDVFKKMDAIANAVSDSCEPAVPKRSFLLYGQKRPNMV